MMKFQYYLLTFLLLFSLNSMAETIVFSEQESLEKRILTLESELNALKLQIKQQQKSPSNRAANKNVLRDQHLNKITGKGSAGLSQAGSAAPHVDVAKNTLSKAKPRSLSKPNLFGEYGKTRVDLQYTLAETSGTQLNVDGFSLLPVFVVGNIQSQDIVRKSETLAVSASVALPGDSQLSVNIPLRKETEQLTNVGQAVTQTRKNSEGVGDIRLTYSQQLFKEKTNIPSAIGSVTWKAPTGKDAYEDPQSLELGSGFHGIRAGVTVLKQDDPAIIYSGIGHTWNLEDDKGASGKIKPGNSVDLSLGLAYALTDKINVNFGLDQVWTGKSKINDVEVINTDTHTASLSVGSKVKLSQKKALDVSAKIGLTNDTPDFQIQFGMPLLN